MSDRYQTLLNAAAKLSQNGWFTYKDLMEETGFSRSLIKYYINVMMYRREWNYTMIRSNKQRQDYEKGVRKQIMEAIRQSPELTLAQLKEMFSYANLTYLSLKQYVYLARKELNIQPRDDVDVIINNILESARKHVREGNAVYIRDIMKDVGLSQGWINHYINTLKKKNMWSYKPYVPLKGPSKERLQMRALMQENPTIVAKEVCERLGLDYPTHGVRINSMLYTIRKVDKIGCVKQPHRKKKD